MQNSGKKKNGLVAITGARGIGLAAAFRFGTNANIVLADNSQETLNDALASLEKAGVTAVGVICDVSSAADVSRFANMAAELGNVSVLFHAAGLSPSMASARRILEVNYLGTQLILSAFVPLLTEGSVAVCFSSLAAYRQRLGEYAYLLKDPSHEGVMEALFEAARDVPAAAYALSKLGIRFVVERAAVELGKRGIRIISISPGAVDTPMGRLEVSKRGMGGAGKMDHVPLGRWVEADEVAVFAQLLCQQAAGYVTGVDIKIDGGAMAYMHHAAPPEMLARFDDPWIT